MKPLTPKQRREIYLKAAKHLNKEINEEYCMCPAIAVACGRDENDYYTPEIVLEYPEFSLFEPYPNAERWYNEGDEKGDRITALLLMSEMTKTAKQ